MSCPMALEILDWATLGKPAKEKSHWPKAGKQVRRSTLAHATNASLLMEVSFGAGPSGVDTSACQLLRSDSCGDTKNQDRRTSGRCLFLLPSPRRRCSPDCQNDAQYTPNKKLSSQILRGFPNHSLHGSQLRNSGIAWLLDWLVPPRSTQFLQRDAYLSHLNIDND